MAVVIGINFRVPGCLLEGDKARGGVSECFGLVTVPFSKQCSQQTLTPPGQPGLCSTDLSTTSKYLFAFQEVEGRFLRCKSATPRPGFKDMVKCLVLENLVMVCLEQTLFASLRLLQ